MVGARNVIFGAVDGGRKPALLSIEIYVYLDIVSTILALVVRIYDRAECGFHMACVLVCEFPSEYRTKTACKNRY